MSLKQDVIEYSTVNKNQSEAGGVFGIDKKLVCYWYRNKDDINKTPFKRRRSRVTIKKDVSKFPELEKELLIWLNIERDKKI